VRSTDRDDRLSLSKSCVAYASNKKVANHLATDHGRDIKIRGSLTDNSTE
jgi:hypothetical protein